MTLETAIVCTFSLFEVVPIILCMFLHTRFSPYDTTYSLKIIESYV